MKGKDKYNGNYIDKQGDTIWIQVILNQLGPFCTYCKSEEKLHLHHIIPLSRGGANRIENLEVVCHVCHRKLHKQIGTVLPLKKNKKTDFIIHKPCGQFGTKIRKTDNNTTEYFCNECNCIFYTFY